MAIEHIPIRGIRFSDGILPETQPASATPFAVNDW